MIIIYENALYHKLLFIYLIDLKFDKNNHFKKTWTKNQLKFFNKWTTSDWEYKIQLEPFLQKFE